MPIGDNPAALIMMPCPGTQETNIDQTLSQLKDQGVSAILTVLSEEEMSILAVETLPETCQQHDIKWFNLKVPNGYVPNETDLSEWKQYKDQLVDIVQQGGTVAAHCKGGTSRTGLGIAMILAELDWPADQAIAAVKSLKPRAFSKLPAVEFIENLADSIKASA